MDKKYQSIYLRSFINKVVHDFGNEVGPFTDDFCSALDLSHPSEFVNKLLKWWQTSVAFLSEHLISKRHTILCIRFYQDL